MNVNQVEREQTIGEEIFNSITHGIGAAAAISGLVILILFALKHHQPIYTIAFSIYGISLCFLYLMSTLYHSIQAKKAKKVFQKLDHVAIFILIAGSYSPFALITLHGFGLWGWSLFGITWLLALGGILLSIFYLEHIGVLNLALYLGMGWLAVFFLHNLSRVIALEGILFLTVGGICYTIGVVFFSIFKFKFHHAVWHLFVIAGSVFHFLTIIKFV